MGFRITRISQSRQFHHSLRCPALSKTQTRYMKRIAVIIGLALASSVGVRATTYYVSTSGSDGNNGTSLSTPWRTINKAAQTMVAGDTVYIRGGTYRESVF